MVRFVRIQSSGSESKTFEGLFILLVYHFLPYICKDSIKECRSLPRFYILKST